MEITLYMKAVIISPLAASVDHRYQQHRGREYNESHRLGYQVYFVPKDLQLENALAFAYMDYLMEAIATGVDQKAAKLMGTYELDKNNIKDEEDADILDVRKYLIASEIREDRVLVPFYCTQLYRLACKVAYDGYAFMICKKDLHQYHCVGNLTS